MKAYNIAVLAGDGIGQEVMPQAIRVLDAISKKYDQSFTFRFGQIGGVAFDQFGVHFPKETQEICEQSDAILFGSVGGPVSESHLSKWKNCEANSILALRKAFTLNANFRPARIYPALREICPLKDRVIGDNIDILIARELIGGIYFGEHKQFEQEGKRYATDLASYNEDQIISIAHHAFKAAGKRSKKVTSVDKANVLSISKLWREVVTEVAADYPDIQLEHMLVDNCAMQLFINPGQFDVIVTSNLFGDILSDAASAIPGSLGLMPSASLNKEGFGLYEPAGGSAPDIAGKNLANPIAQILSAALMLKYSFSLDKEADAIEQAVDRALQDGFRTKDIYTAGTKQVGTIEITDVILGYIG